MAKSVPNSGIPRVPHMVPPMSSGVIFRASVFWKRDMIFGSSTGIVMGSTPVIS